MGFNQHIQFLNQTTQNCNSLLKEEGPEREWFFGWWVDSDSGLTHPEPALDHLLLFQIFAQFISKSSFAFEV
jgi:hypothetical protein